MLSIWEEKRMKSDEQWIEVYKMCNIQENSIPNLSKLVEFEFCLPGTEVERIFSVIFNTWTAEKGQMTLVTFEAILNL